jgi:hypothetical protein
MDPAHRQQWVRQRQGLKATASSAPRYDGSVRGARPSLDSHGLACVNRRTKAVARVIEQREKDSASPSV